MKCVQRVRWILNCSTMIYEPAALTTSLLLLLPALLPAAAASSDVAGGPARRSWCSRVCPSAHAPPSLNLTCPEPRCPQPVCPVPECPSPSCPLPASPCPQCPTASPPSSATLPWKALRSYNATSLGFYKAYNDKQMDWFEAQMLCEEEGAHLVIINSMEEDLFVRTFLMRAPGWIHVGVHDLIREGERTTVLGEPVGSTGFNKWLYGHIHSNLKNNCAWIKTSEHGMGMGPCMDKGPFVCELPIGSYSTS